MVFPETRWSVLAEASLHGDESARRALDELCRRYWQPVFAVIRSRGWSEEVARDRTQAFFLYLMEKSTLRRADRERGRFRTFLLTVLWRFLRDEQKRELAEKRGGDVESFSLDEDGGVEVPSDAGPLSETLDREWALATMERVLDGVRREVVAARGEEGWKALRGFLPGSADEAAIPVAATRLGLTEGGVRTEIHRLRQRCREALRRELMNTVSEPGELDEEIDYLGRVLRRSAANS